MDATRWNRIQALFHEALQQPAYARVPFLERECKGAPDLKAEVLGMLEEDDRNDALLEENLATIAHGVLDRRAPIPQTIGAYKVRRVLGEGGMGVVYLGARDDLGSQVAIKLLRDASLSPARRERFLSEQRALVVLNHPAIVRLYDADFLADQTPYFVMEFVEGTPITQYCNVNELSIAARLRLFQDVCDAVQHAHGHAIIHRDLKPSNILVTRRGAVKLLDFGISKQLESIDIAASQTQTALRIMTPAYAAPEQILGGPVGVYTDVYALGVLLYEMLAGRHPHDFAKQSPAQIEQKILEREPEKPSAVARRGRRRADGAPAAASVSKAAWADLDVLCLKAQNKSPERRYVTVDALLQDVSRYLQREPLEARPDTVGYRLGKFLRRNWQPVATFAVVLSVVMGLVVLYTSLLADARDAALAEAGRTRRIQEFMLDLFQGGEEAVGPADSLRVVTLLDQGVLAAGALDSEPEIQAELFQTLGTLYQGLGNLDRADTLLTSALATRRAILGSDHPTLSEPIIALGLLRVDQARFDDAERLVREGLALAERELDPGHAMVLDAQTALGAVLESRGEYAQAIEVLETVVALRSREKDADYWSALNKLANSHYYLGDYNAFDSLNQVMMAMNRRVHGESHPSVGDNLMNLGAVQFQWGRYDLAETAYRQALDIFESYYGSDHKETASSLTALGRSLVYQDRYDEADPLLRRALTVRERIFGLDHPEVATTRNEIGVAALSRGDLTVAEAQYIRVVDIYRTAYGGDHYFIGIGLSNLASVYLKGEQYERAEPIFREVIEIFSRELSGDHLNTAVARIKLGRVLVRQQRYREAEAELRLGHDLLLEQTDPSVSWIQTARKDLVAVYEALGQTERAAAARAEWGSGGGSNPW